jgi:hypothetical protein
MIYCSQNRFDVNILAFSGLLDGNSFVAKFKILMLLIAVHYETRLSSRQCLGCVTPTLINYKFLYYTYKIATTMLSLLSYYSW